MNPKKIKLIAVLVPLSLITVWSFNVLRISMRLGQSWRVIFSMFGFIIFAALTVVVIQKLSD